MTDKFMQLLQFNFLLRVRLAKSDFAYTAWLRINDLCNIPAFSVTLMVSAADDGFFVIIGV